MGQINLKTMPNYEQKEEIIDKLMVKVFLKVPMLERLKIAIVCKRWKRVLDEMWEDVHQLYISKTYIQDEFGLYEKFDDISMVKKILKKCGPHLFLLKIYNLDSEILNCVRDNCPNVFMVHLELLKTSADYFASAFTKMKELETLNIDISCFSKDEKQLSFIRSLDYLGSVHKEIEEIHLSFLGLFDRQGNDIFHTLQKSLSEFKLLNRFSMKRFNLLDSTVYHIIRNLSLTHLDLRGCRFHSQNVLRTVTNLRQLEYLNLSDIQNARIDDEFLGLLAKYCKQLRHINISNLFYTNNVYTSIIGLNLLASLTQLVTLEVPSTLFMNLRTPLVPLIHLEKLNASSNRALNDEVVRDIFHSYPKLKLCQIRLADISLNTLLYIHHTCEQNYRTDFKLHIGVYEVLKDDFIEMRMPSDILAIEVINKNGSYNLDRD